MDEILLGILEADCYQKVVLGTNLATCKRNKAQGTVLGLVWDSGLRE